MKLDLTDENTIKNLKAAFEYSFNGAMGELTMQFLEEFCGFELGGPRSGDQISSKQLQYEAGKRDIVLTIKTIKNPEHSPEQITNFYKQGDR